MPDRRPSSFAEILDDLCEHPVARRRRYANTELAQLVGERGGDITDGYISLLRKGQRDNPTLQTIEDLAAALEVCPAVFVGGRRERRGEESPRRSFSAKLRHLFEVVYPPGRGPYTPEEVAKAVSKGGRYGTISARHIRELLNPPPGALPNPRLKHILGLAARFGLAEDDGLRAAYFLDDDLAEKIDAELADFVELRAAGVVEMVTRVAQHAEGWTPELRQQAVDAFTQAVSGDTGWFFPRTGRGDSR